MKKEICRFSVMCKGYRADHFTCNHESEAKDFCGYYRRHKAAILRIDMRAMLSGTDLAEFGV